MIFEYFVFSTVSIQHFVCTPRDGTDRKGSMCMNGARSDGSFIESHNGSIAYRGSHVYMYTSRTCKIGRLAAAGRTVYRYHQD